MKKILSLLFGTILFAVYLAGCGGGGGSGDEGVTLKDTSKPTLISTTPAHNSVGVALNSAITVTFNEAIDPATVNAQTFTLMKDGATPVTGNVTCAGATAQFRPVDNLSASASYTATVATGVKDLAGNAMAANYVWQFTTGVAPDSTAPSVLFTFPASNSVGVALNSAITVTFNESIDPATINALTFIVIKNDGIGGTPVAGSVTYVGTTAQFKPEGNLSAGASYTATVTTGVKDLAGNALAANVSWGFTTGSASDQDTAGPQVLSVSPTAGATNVPVDSSFVVSFNEPIMPFEFGLIDGRPVAVTFNDTYTTVTMKPTVAMHSGFNYITSVRLRDMAGNQMPAEFTWQFSTSP
jgi:methionine-rich copper-binding protein CopC